MITLLNCSGWLEKNDISNNNVLNLDLVIYSQYNSNIQVS